MTTEIHPLLRAYARIAKGSRSRDLTPEEEAELDYLARVYVQEQARKEREEIRKRKRLGSGGTWVEKQD